MKTITLAAVPVEVEGLLVDKKNIKEVSVELRSRDIKVIRAGAGWIKFDGVTGVETARTGDVIAFHPEYGEKGWVVPKDDLGMYWTIKAEPARKTRAKK